MTREKRGVCAPTCKAIAWAWETSDLFLIRAGANLRELMERMGHSTTRAAMVYLHSTDERQRKVADAVGDLARKELQDDKKRGTARGASGADLARKTSSATR